MLKLPYCTKHIPTYAFDRFQVAKCVRILTSKLGIEAYEITPNNWELIGKLGQLAEFISNEFEVTLADATLYVQENSKEA